MNAQLETFFNGLHDGVVLLSPDGVVRFINVAAGPVVSLRVGEVLRNHALAGAMHAARQGLITLPHTVTVQACPSFAKEGPVNVQLMWSPGGANIVLLVQSQTESQQVLQASRAIGELINQHCRAPMQSFFGAAELAVEALQSRNPADTEIRRVVDRAMTYGKAVVDKLSQLIAIAQAAEGVPVALDDRVLVGPLLEAVALRARHLAEPRHMRIFVEGAQGDLPAIYGSKPWLERAVYELITCALYCGSNGADVLVSVRAVNGRVGITVRVAGSTSSLPSRDRTFTPFYSGADAEGLYARSLGIGLSFARWVIERHGGNITVSDDQNGIAEFTADLPCGLPGDTPQVDSLAQAQRYAEDLAQLISHTRPATPLAAEIIHTGE